MAKTAYSIKQNWSYCIIENFQKNILSKQFTEYPNNYEQPSVEMEKIQNSANFEVFNLLVWQ